MGGGGREAGKRAKALPPAPRADTGVRGSPSQRGGRGASAWATPARQAGVPACGVACARCPHPAERSTKPLAFEFAKRLTLELHWLSSWRLGLEFAKRLALELHRLSNWGLALEFAKRLAVEGRGSTESRSRIPGREAESRGLA